VPTLVTFTITFYLLSLITYGVGGGLREGTRERAQEGLEQQCPVGLCGTRARPL
jgi:hypothetical protein